VRNERGSVSIATLLIGAMVMLLAAIAAVVTLQGPRDSLAPLGSQSADSTIIPIETRFAVGPLAIGPLIPRTDLSGIVIPIDPADTARVPGGRVDEFWLADDKANRLEFMIVRGRVLVQSGASPMLVVLPITISNPSHLPVGDDMEDLAWLATTGASPSFVAASGETGPGGQGVSWVYLFELRDDGLTLRWSSLGSPPNESVGNNGFEGVALIRLGADTLALLGFKERPDPTYVRSFLFREISGVRGPVTFAPAAGTDSVTLVPLERVGMDRIEGMATQAGACIGPDGDLYVLDRSRRLIAIVDRARLEAAIRDPAENLIPVRERLDYSSLEAMIENKSDQGAPLSPFGTAEGLTFDLDGRLYLLADNNEAGPSTLLTLTPRKPAPPH